CANCGSPYWYFDVW
nr:immunoglobulin heavy chain junction region [Mus musculus]